MTESKTDPGTDVSETLNWRTLTYAEAKTEWVQLGQWVHWLMNRYGLTTSTVPKCWPAHGALVEELSALRTAWLAAYESETRSPIAGVEWHQQFDSARSRMAQWSKTSAGSCDGGQHHTDQSTEAPDPEAFARFVAPDLKTR